MLWLGSFNLDGKVYSCKHCQTHLALCEEIVSKFVHDLMIDSVNVTMGLKEDRMMMTGMHTVSDIFCVGCGSIVGWKYEAAHEKSQKYKEGKFILERYMVAGPDGSQYLANLDSHVGGSDADDA
ncbi:protein yippee-like [Dendrobium catenatum]|uniref:protein yippee-like n=1 Tax=Dendrobium catenatum TaxID=906689 RepID=UPI00109F5754|nr:protein yippee-like [Dendrobium catenatum]